MKMKIVIIFGLILCAIYASALPADSQVEPISKNEVSSPSDPESEALVPDESRYYGGGWGGGWGGGGWGGGGWGGGGWGRGYGWGGGWGGGGWGGGWGGGYYRRRGWGWGWGR